VKKTRAQAETTRPATTKVFAFLFVTVSVWFGVWLKWDVRWLYALACLTVIAAFWSSRRQPILLRALLLLALVFPGCKKADRRDENAAIGEDMAVKDAALISALVTSEETSLTLSPKMSALSKGLLNLRLPGPEVDAQAVFAPSVRVSDVGPAPTLTATNAGMMESRTWPVATETKEVATVDLWRPMLDAVSWFDHAKVYIITGEHPGGDAYRYEAKGGFEALAKMKSGEWCSLHGKMTLTWQRAKATAANRRPAGGSQSGRPSNCITLQAPGGCSPRRSTQPSVHQRTSRSCDAPNITKRR
jgi:hypothetical protein